MDVQQHFVHDPIDLGGPAFRLLRLLKGKGCGIHCEIFQAWVRQREVAISYEALSYVWGSPEAKYVININDRPFRITKNLYEALQHLQSPSQDRVIWVDALCIDQANKLEQGHQVEHMGDIYREAAQVLYWLGPSTYWTKFCFDALRALQDNSRGRPCRAWTPEQWMDSWKSVSNKRNSHPAMERKGLEQLMDRPWFKRIWILQEVANSQAAIVCCGKDSVSARVFTIAPFLMGLEPKPHTQAVLDMMPGLLRKDSWFSGKRDLCTLLRTFRTSDATDPRDFDIRSPRHFIRRHQLHSAKLHQRRTRGCRGRIRVPLPCQAAQLKASYRARSMQSHAIFHRCCS
ncbi:heterokaryon incompatibility protein-domain-containing protein [Immersiella caudata]|uniref:Heterokaryon incompatibility protein-domain-containing protein n=1 Tax=Immersiella caudata TaxID=314043 RepID=A0AA40BTQ8_9PEZI|nr:heterokaryon incompatibility protein-domain-containing protein [Immersiella caudata]